MRPCWQLRSAYGCSSFPEEQNICLFENAQNTCLFNYLVVNPLIIYTVEMNIKAKISKATQRVKEEMKEMEQEMKLLDELDVLKSKKAEMKKRLLERMKRVSSSPEEISDRDSDDEDNDDEDNDDEDGDDKDDDDSITGSKRRRVSDEESDEDQPLRSKKLIYWTSEENTELQRLYALYKPTKGSEGLGIWASVLRDARTGVIIQKGHLFKQRMNSHYFDLKKQLIVQQRRNGHQEQRQETPNQPMQQNQPEQANQQQMNRPLGPIIVPPVIISYSTLEHN